MKRRRLALALWLALLAPITAARDPDHFIRGSLAQIVATRANGAFILAFWSLACAHCQAELAMLGELARDRPRLPLVLVSTDAPGDAPALAATLARHGLGEVESWVFTDDFAERLRYEVDPHWYGELPRSYLYRDGRVAQAASGALDRTTVEAWLAPEGRR